MAKKTKTYTIPVRIVEHVEDEFDVQVQAASREEARDMAEQQVWLINRPRSGAVIERFAEAR